MKLYQINIIGQSDIVSDKFKAHSRKVYMHYPTEDEINEFVQRCTSGAFVNLNKNAPYEIIISELDLVE